MGTLKQRKRFDDLHMAARTGEWFCHPMFRVPGITASAEVIEVEGEIWLYVAHSGEIVDGNDDDAILPDYERVA